MVVPIGISRAPPVEIVGGLSVLYHHYRLREDPRDLDLRVVVLGWILKPNCETARPLRCNDHGRFGPQGAWRGRWRS